MSMNDVSDVDFKEVEASQMLDGQKQSPEQKNPTQKHRILHVQVQGNPRSEELSTVAKAFQEALQAGNPATVTTTANIQCFNIYEDGEAPFNGVIVRGAVSIVNIARAVHDAEAACYPKGFKHWFDLSEETRGLYVKYVKNELRGFEHQWSDMQEEEATVKERLLVSIVNALKPCLPAPQTANLIKIQVWNGNVSYLEDDAWVNSEFAAMKNGNVWRKVDEPSSYFHNVSDSYVNYDGEISFVTVDCIEVIPMFGTSEDQPTLLWKVKAIAEKEAADALLLAQAEDARQEGFAPEEEVQSLVQDYQEQPVTEDGPKDEPAPLTLSEEDAAPAGEEILKPFSDTTDAANSPNELTFTSEVTEGSSSTEVHAGLAEISPVQIPTENSSDATQG